MSDTICKYFYCGSLLMFYVISTSCLIASVEYEDVWKHTKSVERNRLFNNGRSVCSLNFNGGHRCIIMLSELKPCENNH
jgi:hypothetical protein